MKYEIWEIDGESHNHVLLVRGRRVLNGDWCMVEEEGKFYIPNRREKVEVRKIDELDGRKCKGKSYDDIITDWIRNRKK